MACLGECGCRDCHGGVTVARFICRRIGAAGNSGFSSSPGHQRVKNHGHTAVNSLFEDAKSSNAIVTPDLPCASRWTMGAVVGIL